MDVEALKDRYYGSRAATYDDLRVNTPLWQHEEDAIRRVLSGLGPGSAVIDAPVGTGRFFGLYREFGMRPLGIDASDEMLQHATAKRAELGIDAPLVKSDIRALPFGDDAFDAAVCIRFLNWVSPADLHATLHELARVCRRTVIAGVRSYRPVRGRDLLNMRNIGEHLLQLKLRFYHLRTGGSFIYHEPTTVEQAFRTSGLAVRNKISIKTKKRGFDYSIYVAERVD